MSMILNHEESDSVRSQKNSQEAAAKPSSFGITRPVRVGNTSIGGNQFSVIAGPCSIESPEQFLETAQAVRANGASLLRGGIWKMRTSSKSFQGLGENAFSFIPTILNSVGLGLVTEITDPRQMEVLEPIVSMYQVGARNMYNYALLKELGKSKKPVLLKRGFSALVDEWIKATEYISSGGNENIILCERGIRTFENSSRFTFDLNSVLIAKTRTHYPVIVDPSHAIGDRKFVPRLAMAAAAAGADGMIVEVHPAPEKALSDGMQALTLNDFATMMNQMKRVLAALDMPLAQTSSSLEI